MSEAWSKRFDKAYRELYIQIADHTMPDGFYSGYITCARDMTDEKKAAVIREFVDAYVIEKEQKGWPDNND